MTATLNTQTTNRGQEECDTHGWVAPIGHTSPEAEGAMIPDVLPPRGSTSTGGGHSTLEAQLGLAPAGSDHPARQPLIDAPKDHAGGATSSPEAILDSAPRGAAPQGAHATDQGQPVGEAQRQPALVGQDSGEGQMIHDHHVLVALPGPILADPHLAFAADILDDLERTRDGNANRLRQMTRREADSDGEMRGFGLDATHPDVARMEAMVATLDQLTKDAAKNLERQVRKHPLGPWIKAQRGIGDKQAGRLLAAIGDPWWNTLHDRPRTVSELWAYAGLHTDGEHAVKRRKGVKSNWSTTAKTRAWLCIESCMKQIDKTCKTETGIGQHIDGCKCSPYRIAVDQRRAHTAITRPDWTPGHSLNDAMRIASKRLLRDLWIQAREHHQA